MLVYLDFERAKRLAHSIDQAPATAKARSVAFIAPRILEDRLWSEFDRRSNGSDLSQMRVLLIGFDGSALVDNCKLVREAGVASCAACRDVEKLQSVVGMSGAFTHIVINFDAFQSTAAAVTDLLSFRTNEQEFSLIVVSANVAEDDLGSERKTICDATLRAPLTLGRLSNGLVAASFNKTHCGAAS